jgi:hypothetical protein
MAILLLDAETTTQDRHNASIVELAASWMDGPQDLLSECFQMSCRPREGAAIDPESILYNGSQDWINAGWMPREAFLIHTFSAWIRATRPEVQGLNHSRGEGIIMAGWNVAVFDWIILQNAWHLAAISDPFPFSFRTVDLHALAFADLTRRNIHIPTTGLTSALVCEIYGVQPEPKPHRAMGGVRFESELYNKLMCP